MEIQLRDLRSRVQGSKLRFLDFGLWPPEFLRHFGMRLLCLPVSWRFPLTTPQLRPLRKWKSWKSWPRSAKAFWSWTSAAGLWMEIWLAASTAILMEDDGSHFWAIFVALKKELVPHNHAEERMKWLKSRAMQRKLLSFFQI